MKKTLLSLFTLFLVACGGNKITDDMTKQYEARLNSNIKESIALIPNDEKISVKINDFKCQNKKEFVSCESDNLKILLQDQLVLSIDKIMVDDNTFYNGKKSGLISIKDFLKDTLFEKSYSNVKFQGIRIADAFKGMAALVSMQDPKFGFLNDLANGTYDLVLYSDADKNDNVLAKFELTNTINKDFLSFKFDLKLLEPFFDLMDKSGMKYDVAKQDFNDPIEEKIQQLIKPELISKLFNYNNAEINLELNENLEVFKDAFKDDINSNEFAKVFNDIIDEFFASTPHKLKADVKMTEGFDFVANSKDDKLMLENIKLTINGKNISDRLLKLKGE